jgi:hypothetical protein
MVLEIERLHHFFPATQQTHTRWGRRQVDTTLLRHAPLQERLYYALFQSALALCKLAYQAQRLYYSRWSSRPCPTWLPVTETKERIH